MTAQPPIPADAIRRLILARHAAFAAALRAVAESPTVRRVHHSRVCARRLRSLLAVLKPWLARRLRTRARRHLREVAAAFGERREADVRRAWLGRLAAASGKLAPGACRELILRLEEDRERATGRLRRHLASAACQRRLRSIERALGDPQLVIAADIPDVWLRKRVRRRWKTLRRRLHRVSNDADTLHALRIAAKNARYSSDTLAPVLRLDLRRPLGDLKSLQDALGEHRDATEALDWLGRLGEPLGPVLKAQLAAPIRRVLRKRLRQLDRLDGRIEVPDLAPRAPVRGGRRPGRRSPAGAGSARPAGARRGASR